MLATEDTMESQKERYHYDEDIFIVINDNNFQDVISDLCEDIFTNDVFYIKRQKSAEKQSLSESFFGTLFLFKILLPYMSYNLRSNSCDQCLS